MKYKKFLYIGLAVFLLSLVLGLVGTAWSIGGLEALWHAENVGIGPVGAVSALAFSIIGVVGSLVGIGLMTFAVVKMKNTG